MMAAVCDVKSGRRARRFSDVCFCNLRPLYGELRYNKPLYKEYPDITNDIPNNLNQIAKGLSYLFFWIISTFVDPM